MKKIVNYLFILLLCITTWPVLGGCSSDDDVIEIFTGKTWKLSFIAAEGTRKQFNYWPDDTNGTAYQNSMKLMKTKENFTITFTGGELGEGAGGTFSGRGVTSSFNGKWQGNGDSHKLSLHTKVSGRELDVLAIAYVTGLQNVIRYGGDSENLFIYFKEGQTTKYMGFTRAK